MLTPLKTHGLERGRVIGLTVVKVSPLAHRNAKVAAFYNCLSPYAASHKWASETQDGHRS